MGRAFDLDLIRFVAGLHGDGVDVHLSQVSVDARGRGLVVHLHGAEGPVASYLVTDSRVYRMRSPEDGAGK